jgi:hypothetical protein
MYVTAAFLIVRDTQRRPGPNQYTRLAMSSGPEGQFPYSEPFWSVFLVMWWKQVLLFIIIIGGAVLSP